MKSLGEIMRDLMQSPRHLKDAIPDNDDWPMLAPAEHQWVERMVGRHLTNEEAQSAIRAASVEAAVRYWSDGKVD